MTPERLFDPREDKTPPTAERCRWIVEMMWDAGMYTQAREVQRLADAYWATPHSYNANNGHA